MNNIINEYKQYTPKQYLLCLAYVALMIVFCVIADTISS